MRLFLCGYGDAGRFVLRNVLRRDDVDDLAVWTHPDTDYARGLEREAFAAGVFVLCDDVNDMTLWPFKPTVIASVCYRTIIEPHVIETVRGKIFNAHLSLLPRHRGRSPVPWAIIENDQYTGVTFHYIDEGIDTGPIIFQVAVRIWGDETQESLFGKLNRAVRDYWGAALMLVEAGFEGVGQEGGGNYHGAGVPYAGQIDPAWSDERVDRFIRAMIYPPYPAARFMGTEIKTFGQFRRAWIEHQIFERGNPNTVSE